MSPGRDAGPGLVLHVPGHMLGPDEAALPGLFQKLAAGFRSRGVRVETRWRDRVALAEMGETADLHLIHNGAVRHPRALNTGLAYVFPFWYCDAHGIFADSSLASAAFDPGAEDPEAAASFFAAHARRIVGQRLSRYGQPNRRAEFAGGAIAVFLQGDSEPVERMRHMREAEMFEAVVTARGERKLIVKAHPRNRSGDTGAILERARGLPGVTVTDANVHDILAASAVTVSISSATALEGMFHRVPAVLCGRSDLHHCAETARDPGAVAEALRTALGRTYPFEAFVHWFLGAGMLNTGRDDLLDRVVARFRARGVDMAALGLHG